MSNSWKTKTKENKWAKRALNNNQTPARANYTNKHKITGPHTKVNPMNLAELVPYTKERKESERLQTNRKLFLKPLNTCSSGKPLFFRNAFSRSLRFNASSSKLPSKVAILNTNPSPLTPQLIAYSASWEIIMADYLLWLLKL